MRLRTELLNVALGLTIAATAAGCPLGGGSNSNKVPLDQMGSEYASMFCSVVNSCFGSAFGQGNDCEAQFTAQFEDSTQAQWQAAVDRGTLIYDEKKMRDCIDALKAQGCDLLSAELPAACDEALVGSVASGAACDVDEECSGKAYCDNNAACPGACKAFLAADADCSSGGNCGKGLQCLSGLCKPDATEGQACGGGSAAYCSGNLDCTGEDGGTPGTCTKVTVPPVVALGASCDPQGGTFCQSGLTCAAVSMDATTYALVWECQAAASAGGACHLGVPEQCPTNQFCFGVDFATQTLAGTCTALPAEGAACADVQSGEGCQSGLACNDAQKCFKPKRIGEACAGDGDCVSDACDASLCIVPMCG